MIINNLTKTYRAGGSDVEVFNGLSLNIPEQEITVILGPSGCGKTTLLNSIAGLAEQDSGEIIRDESDCSISFIFQEPRLLPWMSVSRNIDLVLQNAFPDKNQRSERISRFLGLVGLTDSAEMYPEELSGGMKQRVSIARAFAYPSNLILMDEPFQSLDLKLRIELIHEYTKLWDRDPRTTLLVTHDVREALLLADTIFLLSDRPAAVVESFIVNIDRSNRFLGKEDMLAVEQRIYAAMNL
ncbi:MAG: ATP-binding cassette domain-containing protein [Bacteroidetes bacterium]|nr:ATP-binding cassette domain-containing protein [Bacteroidota bacterium]